MYSPPVSLRFATVAAVLVVVLYWGGTLLYVSPINFIRVQFDSELREFGRLFYQRWDFFAPPPRTNTRLYYAFFSQQDSSLVSLSEVMRPITVAKQRRAPFNAEEEIVDYVLAGSAISLSRLMGDQVDILRVVYPDSSEQALARIANEIVLASAETSPAYLTITNYALLVARQQGIDPESHLLQITIAEADIAPFSERGKEKEPVQDRVVFRSDHFKPTYRRLAYAATD